MKDEIKEIEQFDVNLEKNLEDFMEVYKMIDVEQIYSNGTEFVPIYRVKQWLEYNNITNLQKEYEKADNDRHELFEIKEKAIEYIHNHQLVFELSSKKQIQDWFDMFYKDSLNILNGGDE